MDSQFLFHILRREAPLLLPGAAALFQLCYQLLHRHQLFILAVFLHIQSHIAAMTVLGQKYRLSHGNIPQNLTIFR